MTPLLLAFLAAVLYSVSQVSTRRALDHNEPLIVVLGTLATTFTTVTALMFVFDRAWQWPALAGLAILLLAGFVAPGSARLFGAVGLRDFGPLVAVPYQFGTRPIIALAAGVILFGERVTPMRVAALLSIVAGLFWLTAGYRSEASFSERQPDSIRLWIPAMAGVAYAVSEILRKAGVAYTDSVTAAWLAGAAAFGLVTLTTVSIPRLRSELRAPRDVRWILFSGVAAAVAQVVMFTALAVGDITIVSPVMALQPMIVMLIAPGLAAAGGIGIRSVWKGGLVMTIGAIVIGLTA